jgi:hypothetical protein
MTRNELINRIRNVVDEFDMQPRAEKALKSLIADIESDGVLDVQCPDDIAETMNLPRPAKR